MGKRSVILAVLCFSLVAIVSAEWGGGGQVGPGWGQGGGGGGGGEPGWPWGGEGGSGWREGEAHFLLQDSQPVVKTFAGEVRIVRGFRRGFVKSPMHIGFITMEPNSLFIPQYLDSSLILFINRGEVKVGHIYKDALVEKKLKTGDIYSIAAGMPFYLVNTADGQRLQIICSVDTSDSLGFDSFQPFYIGGGKNPVSVLSGFDQFTLSVALNVSIWEVGELFSKLDAGPIVFVNVTHSPSVWTTFMNLDGHRKLTHMKRIVHIGVDGGEEEKHHGWSFRNLMKSIFGSTKKDDKRSKRGGPDAYNLYDKKPNFKNDNGWSIAVDKSNYAPLNGSDFGVFLVNLNAGSMMAPHVNPMATEYGVVLSGAGTIQVVYPNGSLAMNAEVKEGDVFCIPRFFPFCQIASQMTPFVFFGFTTSASNNKPQSLVGANSLLQLLRGPELANAFGLTEQRLKQIVEAQNDTTILTSASVSPPKLKAQAGVEKAKNVAKMIKTFGSDEIKAFD